MKHINPGELSAWLVDDASVAPLLLDVRETWEYAHCHLPGSINIPMATVPLKLTELDPDRPVVTICHHGMRSYQVAMFLERNGFDEVINLTGGVAAWADDVDPAMPRY